MGIRLNVTAFLVGSAIAVLVLAIRKAEAVVAPVEEPPVFVEPIIQPPVPIVEVPIVPLEVVRQINVTIPDPVEVAIVAVGV